MTLQRHVCRSGIPVDQTEKLAICVADAKTVGKFAQFQKKKNLKMYGWYDKKSVDFNIGYVSDVRILWLWVVKELNFVRLCGNHSGKITS